MKKLYRSAHDKKLFGLCGGLGEHFNVDPTLLRVVLVVTTIFTGGVVIALYILASLVIPKEPTFDSPYQGGYSGSYNGGGNYSYGNSYGSQYGSSSSQRPNPQPEQSTNLDEMMKDIETKAMKKEIEELRAKLAKYEKGE
jgi:phage shock protein C